MAPVLFRAIDHTNTQCSVYTTRFYLFCLKVTCFEDLMMIDIHRNM
jgi:hypothetical protein